MFVVTYSTESGDSGVAGVFSEFPDEGHLSAIAVRDYPHEVVEDDGEPFKCISFTVHTVDGLQALPEPIEPIDGP